MKPKKERKGEQKEVKKIFFVKEQVICYFVSKFLLLKHKEFFVGFQEIKRIDLD